MNIPNNNSKISPSILTLNIKDKQSLHAAYMPFIKGGGLFIPTKKKYSIGDDIFLLLTLPNSPERLPISGKVVWYTPPNSHGGRVEGVGVQFSNLDGSQGSGEIKKKVEDTLAGVPDTIPRSTM